MHILSYLLNPTLDLTETNTTFKSNLKGTLIVFVIYLIGVVALALILKLIDSLILVYFFHHSILNQLILSNKAISNDFGKYSFLVLVLVGPFFEEIIFRLPLNLEKIAVGAAAGLISYRLLMGKLFIFDPFNISIYINLTCSSVIFLLIWKFTPSVLLSFIKDNYRYFFYLVAIAFALFHLSNFNYFNNDVLLFYPIFILPQFLMALLLGYVRLHYGFFYGIVLHSLINLPAALANL